MLYLAFSLTLTTSKNVVSAPLWIERKLFVKRKLPATWLVILADALCELDII